LAAADEDLAVYTEHPRLFLTARRLRLLRREKERQSMRWEQFSALVSGKAPMPEKGFAYALYAQVARQPEYCKEAVAWAQTSQDLRQIAIVYDWCSDEAAGLLPRIRQLLALPRPADLDGIRTRLLAAIAASEQPRDFETELKWVVETWWRGQMLPGVKGGRRTMGRTDAYALAELMHALIDNFHVEISEDLPKWFKDLPTLRLLQYYPASFPSPDNQYRIPAYVEDGEPSIAAATFARAADLALVACDPNSQTMQFLQGWAMHDQFLMRSALGAPYEFLWANPYQPGLSYYFAPLVLHDEASGQLFARSGWDDEAGWFGFMDGRGQAFTSGTRKDVKPAAAPVQFGPAVILAAPPSMKFVSDLPDAEPNAAITTFVFGLKPHGRYLVEMDLREMTEEEADAGGILALSLPPGQKVNVRLREARGKFR
ncbi:MAG: hypothetical protein NTY38_30335, partial [Acidobacteria bacterium]|nr:hypothetical protein [Acidobacteriota bacterium]